MLIEPNKKKIVYIMGLGRSGTTLMDVVLGNGENCFSCGEICRYPLRQGMRRNIPKDSTRHQFWNSVLDRLKSLDMQYVDFEYLQKLHHRYEYHTGYIRDSLLGLRVTRDLKDYYDFLRAFYEVLFEESGKSVLIDSSKYAGRAWHLSRALPTEQYEICYLYIKRSPISVGRSFRKENIEQSSKNCLTATLIYFVVNTICHKSCNRLAKDHRLARVTFETFLADPACLENVGKELGIDLDPVREKIRLGQPLQVGNLFDGNRIRNREEIMLQQPFAEPGLSMCDRFSWLVNRRIYQA